MARTSAIARRRAAQAQSGFALQSFAYSKLLWMWLGYSRGVGKFVQPALPVSRWYDRFVGVFVTAVLLNYGAQLLIAAAFYDIAKADRADDGAAEPAGIAGARAAAAPCAAIARHRPPSPAIARHRPPSPATPLRHLSLIHI